MSKREKIKEVYKYKEHIINVMFQNFECLRFEVYDPNGNNIFVKNNFEKDKEQGLKTLESFIDIVDDGIIPLTEECYSDD